MVPLTGPTVVRELVEQQLRRLYGSAETDAQGDFVVRQGEVTAWVRVVGLMPDVTAVVVFAFVAGPLERSDDACRFLAAESLEMPVGHFELHGDGRALSVSHTLLGEFLSGEELRFAVDAVLTAAGDYGPRVRAEYGAVLPHPHPEGAATPAEAEALDQLLRAIQAAGPAAASPEPAGRPARRSRPWWQWLVFLVLALWVGATVGAFLRAPDPVAAVPSLVALGVSWAVVRRLLRAPRGSERRRS